jgi:glycosyltransferase 2 family protein
VVGVPEPDVSAPPAGTPPRRVSARVVRLAGILVALLALSLCGLALADQWRSVKLAIEHADYRLLLVAFVAAALGMSGLGVLWWQCLRVFGERAALPNSIAWYFAGELGKYLPGGIWPVLGRGELAHRRGGISRSTGYATTLICYAAMVAAAAVTCGFAAPVLAIDNHVPGWEWLIVGLIPLAVLGAHPAVFGRLLGAARRVTKGRVDLETPSWSKMLALIAIAIPTWVLVGVSSIFVARALGFDHNPVRIAFAAVAAWIIGFLAVPVPAGVGLRELIFVALCGLPAGPAAAVAAGARLILVCVDGVGGAIGLCVPGIPARTDPQHSGRDAITESGVAGAKR